MSVQDLDFIEDRILDTTTTTGTGTYTVAGPVTGYQGISEIGNSNSAMVAVWAVDGSGIPTGAWETSRGNVYTSAGTTLSRGTFVNSSTGSVISWGAGTKRIALALPAELLQGMAQFAASGPPGVRLTLTQGTPVTTSDVTAATTIYAEPYNGDTVPLFRDTAGLIPIRKKLAASSLSLALGTLASGTIPNDVFLDWNVTSAGVLSLTKVPWTSTSARATAIDRVGGLLYKNGDYRFLLLGTFTPMSTTTTEDSVANRHLWNAYNQIEKLLSRTESSSHTLNNQTAREWNGGTADRIAFTCGLYEGPYLAFARSLFSASASAAPYVQLGLGNNSTTGQSYPDTFRTLAAATQVDGRLKCEGPLSPALGVNFVCAVESEAASATVTMSSVQVTARVKC